MKPKKPQKPKPLTVKQAKKLVKAMFREAPLSEIGMSLQDWLNSLNSLRAENLSVITSSLLKLNEWANTKG